MNDPPDYPDNDPFAPSDPEAAAREARRLEREARRTGQPAPAPQPPVQETGADQQPDPEPSPEPPAAAPAAEVESQPPEPAPLPSEPEPPDSFAGPSEADPPPPVPPQARINPLPRDPAPAGRRFGPPSGGWVIWGRRLVALVVILAAVGLVLYALTQIDGDEPPPAPEGKPLKTVSVTIPEGLTIDQIKPIAKDAGLKGDYAKAAKKAPKGFPLGKYGENNPPNLEGFLFPATYELEKGAPVSDLVEKQLDAFQDNLAEVKLAYSKDKNLTVYDVVKIASMVEREVQVPNERELVAAVIYNRLSAGDTLGIDATLRYELKNYDEQLLQSELEAATPYNTRVVAGLPPTPIANPGLDSLEAAANPAKSDFYYFVVKPGTCGEHFFTADSAEFDAAAAEYQSALQAEGNSPTEC